MKITLVGDIFPADELIWYMSHSSLKRVVQKLFIIHQKNTQRQDKIVKAINKKYEEKVLIFYL